MMGKRTIERRLRSGSFFLYKSGPAPQSADTAGDGMAKNHYSSKSKRRPKNSNRKDPSAATMAALRQREATAKK
jgi:hypothetical protein